jgi:hypothetical protein
MASAGTLISDLDGDGMVGNSENDIVAQIMADMNGSSAPVQQKAQQMQAPPMPIPSPRIIQSPNPNTITHNVLDPSVATAHIIGNRQPSPADFASLMGMPGNAAFMPLNGPGFGPNMYTPQKDEASNGIMASIFPGGNLLREFKIPILVAIIFYAMSLPVVNIMIGHYFPRLLRIGGDLTMIGLGVKSLLAGVVFFIIQRVLVPLVTN